MSTRLYRLVKGARPGFRPAAGVTLTAGEFHLSAAQAAALAWVVEEVNGTGAPTADPGPAADDIRVHEVAKALGIKSAATIKGLQEIGFDVASHANTVPASATEALRNHLAGRAGDSEGE